MWHPMKEPMAKRKTKKLGGNLLAFSMRGMPADAILKMTVQEEMGNRKLLK